MWGLDLHRAGPVTVQLASGGSVCPPLPTSHLGLGIEPFLALRVPHASHFWACVCSSSNTTLGPFAAFFARNLTLQVTSSLWCSFSQSLREELFEARVPLCSAQHSALSFLSLLLSPPGFPGELSVLLPPSSNGSYCTMHSNFPLLVKPQGHQTPWT